MTGKIPRTRCDYKGRDYQGVIPNCCIFLGQWECCDYDTAIFCDSCQTGLWLWNCDCQSLAPCDCDSMSHEVDARSGFSSTRPGQEIRQCGTSPFLNPTILPRAAVTPLCCSISRTHVKAVALSKRVTLLQPPEHLRAPFSDPLLSIFPLAKPFPQHLPKTLLVRFLHDPWWWAAKSRVWSFTPLVIRELSDVCAFLWNPSLVGLTLSWVHVFNNLSGSGPEDVGALPSPC